MKFSIVTVCRNSAAVLPNALASLKCQTHSDREWVVIDGASTDGTFDLVRTSGEVLGNGVSEPDAGIYEAMNKGWRRACGDAVFFLNSDDAFASPDVVAEAATLFRRDPAVDLVIGEVIYRYSDGHMARRNFSHLGVTTLLFEDICHQAVFARRSLFERIGGFNAAFRLNADYDWLIRAFRAGAKVGWLDRPVAFFNADGGAHRRDFGSLVAERRRVRLQYLSRPALAAGLLASRVGHRLHRIATRRRIGDFPYSIAT